MTPTVEECVHWFPTGWRHALEQRLRNTISEVDSCMSLVAATEIGTEIGEVGLIGGIFSCSRLSGMPKSRSRVKK